MEVSFTPLENQLSSLSKMCSFRCRTAESWPEESTVLCWVIHCFDSTNVVVFMVLTTLDCANPKWLGLCLGFGSSAFQNKSNSLWITSSRYPMIWLNRNFPGESACMFSSYFHVFGRFTFIRAQAVFWDRRRAEPSDRFDRERIRARWKFDKISVGGYGQSVFWLPAYQLLCISLGNRSVQAMPTINWPLLRDKQNGVWQHSTRGTCLTCN